MIPPGDCMYAGRKRRKPIQKQRPTVGAEKSNPSKRHRDRLNAELDHLASLLPLPPDVTSKLDKLSVLRLSVSYLRVKSFFQVVQEKCSRQPAAGAPSPGDARALGGSAVLEGRLLLESLNGFALVVSAEGMIFYASATIVDYLGFHQTDVMHQNIYDYIHVDDRRDFCRQLHWAMDPPLAVCGQPPRSETGDDAVLGRLLRAQEGGAGSPTEYSAFLTRCFVCRVRCLLDSTSGFLTMQFQGKLKFLFGQKKKAPSGTVLPPRLSLFCIVAPVLLPSMAETTMKSTFLRARHRADPTVPPDTRAKATTSLCESELQGKPNYLAGKSGGGNGISVYGAQTDAGRWPRGPARAPCLCFRSGPNLVLDPKGAAGDQEEEEQERPLSCSSGVRGWKEMHTYNCRFEALGPTRYLSWTAEKCCQDGSVTRKLQPSKCNLFSMCATPRGSCTPYPGVQGTFNASSITVFRNSPLSHPPGQPPSVYSSRTSRPTRDVAQGQVHPPACHFPQGSLENQLPEPGAQCFAAGVYSTEDAKLRSLQTPLGAPCNPVLPLDVPIKMENDSGSEDTADGYSASQVWLGASDVARKHLVAFPSRMHLKTEPDSRCQLYMPHLGHSVLGAPPHGRATAGPSRELAPFYPTQCTCLECMRGLPEPEPPHHLCTQGCGEHQPSTLGCDCRAPGATPMVKQEPLDSPPWDTRSQRGVPGMFRKSALGTLIPPKAPECAFLL